MPDGGAKIFFDFLMKIFSPLNANFHIFMMLWCSCNKLREWQANTFNVLFRRFSGVMSLDNGGNQEKEVTNVLRKVSISSKFFPDGFLTNFFFSIFWTKSYWKEKISGMESSLYAKAQKKIILAKKWTEVAFQERLQTQGWRRKEILELRRILVFVIIPSSINIL